MYQYLFKDVLNKLPSIGTLCHCLSTYSSALKSTLISGRWRLTANAYKNPVLRSLSCRLLSAPLLLLPTDFYCIQISIFPLRASSESPSVVIPRIPFFSLTVPAPFQGIGNRAIRRVCYLRLLLPSQESKNKSLPLFSPP